MPPFLKSRGFWTAALATVGAVATCLVQDGNCGEAILAAGAAWLGFLGVTAARAQMGVNASWARSQAALGAMEGQTKDLKAQLLNERARNYLKDNPPAPQR